MTAPEMPCLWCSFPVDLATAMKAGDSTEGHRCPRCLNSLCHVNMWQDPGWFWSRHPDDLLSGFLAIPFGWVCWSCWTAVTDDDHAEWSNVMRPLPVFSSQLSKNVSCRICQCKPGALPKPDAYSPIQEGPRALDDDEIAAGTYRCFCGRIYCDHTTAERGGRMLIPAAVLKQAREARKEKKDA